MDRFERIKESFEKSKRTGITIWMKDIEWLVLSHIEQEGEIKRLKEKLLACDCPGDGYKG